MTPIRLIAADMDGTLLDSRSRLPAGIFPMIRELTGQGIRFVIASGRQYYNLESLFRPVADRLTFVAENGAAVFEKGELHRKLPFMLSSLMWEKSTLADSACRTGISTSSALHAGICIDYVMIISLRNSTCWALALACSTAYALVRNYICHCYILL